MVSGPIGVRPTRRCLGDLGIELPDLEVRLEEVDQPVIVSAQAVPEQRDAGGAERVVALTDRVWFKVKTSDYRAAVTELRGTDLPDWVRPSRGAWWVGAAGRRQGDSAQREIYAALQRECTTGRTGSSAHLLPADWDWKRLAAEQAIAWRREMKRVVIRLVAMSLKNGQLAVAEFRNHRIKALVRAETRHEAYLAIIAEGVPDPQMFALLLDCVPGVAPEDWQPEPSSLAEMSPGSGEVAWSTLTRTWPSAPPLEVLEDLGRLLQQGLDVLGLLMALAPDEQGRTPGGQAVQLALEGQETGTQGVTEESTQLALVLGLGPPGAVEGRVPGGLAGHAGEGSRDGAAPGCDRQGR